MAEEKKAKAAEAAEAKTPETATAAEATETVVEKKEQVPAQDPKEFLDNFNWEKYEQGIEKVEDAKLEEFEKLVSENFVDTADEEVVTGTVVYLTDREAIIDINAKSEGVISLNEFRYNPDLKVGDNVEVLIDIRAHDNEEVVSGFVKCRTKGGMIVDVFGIEAFLPGSQIDVKPIRDYDQYVNKTMEFKVVKINHEFKNVVVSHKALIEADIEEQKKEIISQLEKGQVLEGVVKNVTSYGVFIDLLGLKQLEKHPWEALSDDIKIGDKVKGKVVVIADYGAFIEVVEGVEGLVHVSEMSWSTHLRSAQDFVKVGDEIEAVVLTLDREDRKMSLGVKQLTPDPWTDITTKYPVASRHEGIVRNFTNFGVFVELEEGIDGLIYISDLSWTKKIKHPSEFVTVGDKIEVEVLELDVDGRKLSLGHKQTTENPWDKYEAEFALGTIHKGSITEIVDKGATIDFNDDITAFIPQRHLEKEDGKKLGKGEEAEFKIIEFNKDFKRVVASHTAIFRAEEERIVRSAAKRKSKSSDESKPTLGDANEALQALKDKMEAGAKKK